MTDIPSESATVGTDEALVDPTRQSPTPPPEASSRGSVSRQLIGFGERYALVGLTIVVFAIFSLLPSTSATFFNWTNIQEVLADQSVVMILAIGVLFPLVMGSFDISVGALSGACAVVCATCMSRFHMDLVPAIVICMAFGALIGAIHGLLIAGLRLNAFIVTLGSSTLFTGLISAYTGGNDIETGISNTLGNFGAENWLGIPAVLYLVVVVVVIGWYVLEHTPFGRYVHAVGSNGRAAELVGINVTRLTFMCFFISGVVCGLAGVTLVAIDDAANITEGPALLFPVLTAVFLSATTIRTGIYNVVGTVVGVLLTAFAVSGFTLLGADTWVSDVFNGFALVVAVTVSTVLARKRAKG